MLVYVGASTSLHIRYHHGLIVGVKSQINNNQLTQKKHTHLVPRSSRRRVMTIGLAAAAASVLLLAVGAHGVENQTQEQEQETFSNVPQTLSGECVSGGDCKRPRIQRPNSKKAESCTTRCLTCCIYGGDRLSGEAAPNARRPMVVFRQGFRSRQYCLVECSDICNLIGEGEDGF